VASPEQSASPTAGLVRVAGAGGLGFVLLQLGSQGLIQVGGVEPAFDAPAEEIVRFFEARNRTLFEVGSYLSLLSFVAWIWFLGALWARFRLAEPRPAWLSLVAFGSGLMFLAALSAGWYLAVFRIEEGLDPQFARLAFDQGNLGFANSWIPLGSMLLAAGLLVRRTHALPRWLGWLALGTAPLLLAARAVWTSPVAFAPYVLFWVWVVGASVVLVLRGIGTGPGDDPPVPASVEPER
jgi:hypothetical protein